MFNQILIHRKIKQMYKWRSLGYTPILAPTPSGDQIAKQNTVFTIKKYTQNVLGPMTRR